MERTRLIRHGGRDVVLIDLVNASSADILDEVPRARDFIAARSGDALLTLTDVTGARYDADALDAMKRLATENKDRVRASAVVSDNAAQRAAVSLVSFFARRRFQSFDTRDAALDWLVKRG